MSQLQLLETMRMENGELPLLSYHLTRMHTARKRVWRHKHPLQSVDKMIKTAFEKACLKQNNLTSTPIVRCRVLYQREIERIEFLPYSIKTIDSVVLIEDDKLKYGVTGKWMVDPKKRIIISAGNRRDIELNISAVPC